MSTLASNIIAEVNAKASRQDFQGNKWGERHYKAFQTDRTGIAGMIKAWAHYADAHRTRYEASIGDDGFLGPEWAEIGKSLRALLNGDLGQMDGGTLDDMICDILSANGFDPDTL